MILKEYDYKPKWTIVFLAGGFFGLCGAFFVHLARTNDRGLIINGIIELSPSGAVAFFCVLAVVSFLFVLAAIVMVFVRLSTTKRIAVTEDGLLLPAGRWTSRECAVPFKDITSVKRIEVSGQVFLYVYASGLRYTVAKGMLPNVGDFEEIVGILQEKAT